MSWLVGFSLTRKRGNLKRLDELILYKVEIL